MVVSRTVPVLAALVGAMLLAIGVAVIAGSEPAEAAFPGENGKIAFVNQGESTKDVTSVSAVNPDGSGLVNLTADIKLAVMTAEDAAWSADGRRIAFVAWSSSSGGQYDDMWAMDADGSNNTNLTDDGAATWEHDPSWFPSGDRIAFVANGSPWGSGGDLYALRLGADGGAAERVRLTRTPNHLESDPVVSPDGTKIAFMGYRPASGRHQVYVMRAEPRSPTNRPQGLTSGPRQGYGPDWSPDGQQIAFSRHLPTADGNAEIFVMDADGTNKRRLTRNPAYDSDPAFSPDGKQIAFLSTRSAPDRLVANFSDIWKMNADGSDPTQVTADFFSEIGPDWQPLP
jgi:TolB protein